VSDGIAAGGASIRRHLPGATYLPRHFPRLKHWPWHLAALALVGTSAASGVGYLVSQNPHAAPAHVAVVLRVALIVVLMGAGTYGLSGRGERRMGVLLVGAGLYASVWLLNGASERLAFTAGLVAAGVAPTVFAYLILAYPSGRLQSDWERVLLALAGGALFMFSTLYVLSSQPPLRTPLVSRAPHDALSLVSIGPGVATALKAGIWLSWTTVACGTAVLVSKAVRSASGPGRRAWLPFEIVAWATAGFYVAFLVARASGWGLTDAFGAAYVEVALAIPVAILVKLGLDRALMSRALAGLIEELADNPRADPCVLMARALNDPSLSIAYPRPGLGTYVDASGAPVSVPERDPARAVTWIGPTDGPLAAVVYDAKLANQEALVHAAGTAASLRLEASQLQAELDASTGELAASRRRLVDAADAERRRIERDLHDGVQQQVVGLRLMLDLASEAIKSDPSRGERMLATVGRDLDELLKALRSFASGIYPAILSERGLRQALVSVSLNVPVPVSVVAGKADRYQEDIELAVYFCCVESIQNIMKHAGPTARGAVRLWQRGGQLRFEVRDSGEGFDPAAVSGGSGLVNMRDRIEAVGGTLWVTSEPGGGTSVRGKVPIPDGHASR
jgi:signal transduction histidine kinase